MQWNISKLIEDSRSSIRLYVSIGYTMLHLGAFIENMFTEGGGLISKGLDDAFGLSGSMDAKRGPIRSQDLFRGCVFAPTATRGWRGTDWKRSMVNKQTPGWKHRLTIIDVPYPIRLTVLSTYTVDYSPFFVAILLRVPSRGYRMANKRLKGNEQSGRKLIEARRRGGPAANSTGTVCQ